jgi:hypothetical protein
MPESRQLTSWRASPPVHVAATVAFGGFATVLTAIENLTPAGRTVTVPRARPLARDTLAGWSLGRRSEEVSAVVSELAASAVEQAPAPGREEVLVRNSRTERLLFPQVGDRDPAGPPQPSRPAPRRPFGQGRNAADVTSGRHAMSPSGSGDPRPIVDYMTGPAGNRVADGGESAAGAPSAGRRIADGHLSANSPKAPLSRPRLRHRRCNACRPRLLPAAPADEGVRIDPSDAVQDPADTPASRRPAPVEVPAGSHNSQPEPIT